jgi:hypothetical protein
MECPDYLPFKMVFKIKKKPLCCEKDFVPDRSMKKCQLEEMIKEIAEYYDNTYPNVFPYEQPIETFGDAIYALTCKDRYLKTDIRRGHYYFNNIVMRMFGGKVEKFEEDAAFLCWNNMDSIHFPFTKTDPRTFFLY